MTSVAEYLLYVTGLLALALAFEGLVRLVRTQFGEDRAIARRLAKARARATGGPTRERRELDALAQAIGLRLPWLQRAITRADAPLNALQIVLMAAAVFLVVCLLGQLGHVPQLITLVAASVVAFGAPMLILTTLASRRRKRFLDQLPQAVDLIARSLQAGHPVTTAMTVVGQRMAAPLGPEFRMVVEEMTYGLDRDEALNNLLRRFPLPELQMFVACLEVTRESGGNLAEVFLKLAEAIRAKDHLRRKIVSITAEGRMTFWVVTALPFVVLGLLLILQPSFYAEVAQDSLFWPMLSFAPTTLAIGSTMIWRMVNLKV